MSQFTAYTTRTRLLLGFVTSICIGLWAWAGAIVVVCPDIVSPVEDTAVAGSEFEVTTTGADTIGISHTTPSEFKIDWGDGSVSNLTTSGTTAHTYAGSGTYTVTLSGDSSVFRFVTNPSKVTGILSPIQGLPGLTSFVNSFNATDIQNIPSGWLDACTNVTSMHSIFKLGDITNVPSGLFDYCTNVTVFRASFQSCNMISIPSGLFDNNTLAEDFNQTFYACPLTDLPDNLFSNCNEVTTFYGCLANSALTNVPAGTFAGCSNVLTYELVLNSGDFETLPPNLFADSTEVTTFQQAFGGMHDWVSIPADLFRYNTKVTTFESLFLNSNFPDSAIPEGLFYYNTNVTTFEECFIGCPNVTTVPANLFASNSLAVNFTRTFQLSGMADIPAGLFDGCPLITEFTYCFLESGVTNVPVDLFKNNTAVGFFYLTFSDTPVRTVPIDTFTNAPAADVRFAFRYCASYTGPLCTFPSSCPKALDMYRDCSSLTGDLSVVEFPATLEDFGCEDSLVTYTTAGGGLMNVPNGFDLDIAGCNLDSNDVTFILQDLDTSGATGGSVLIAGDNDAPTAAGYTAKTNLVGKSWTVTSN